MMEIKIPPDGRRGISSMTRPIREMARRQFGQLRSLDSNLRVVLAFTGKQ